MKNSSDLLGIKLNVTVILYTNSAFLKPFFPRPKIAKNNDLQI